MLLTHWEDGARATLLARFAGEKLGLREGGAEGGGSRGEFRAARAVRFRRGSARSGFALFLKCGPRRNRTAASTMRM